MVLEIPERFADNIAELTSSPDSTKRGLESKLQRISSASALECETIP